MRALLLFLLLCAPVHAWAAITADVVASETTCRAPCPVLVDAHGGLLGGTGTQDTDTSISELHDIRYSFDFGERAENPAYDATWGDSWGGEAFLSNFSKDEYVGGPFTFHLYETPGTYTITVEACNANDVCDTDTTSVTVTAWSDGDTICVFNSSVGSGCPAGATQASPTNSAVTAVGLATAGKRVLLKRGDTFPGSFLDFAPSAEALIGAYGSGDRPIIDAGGSQTAFILGGTRARVMDLEVRNSITVNGLPTNGLFEAQSLAGGTFKALLLRVKTTNGTSAVSLKGGDGDYHEIYVVDSELGTVASRNDGKEGGKVIDGDYDRSAFVGNRLGGSPDGFNVRIYSSKRTVFQFNYFAEDCAGNKACIRFQGVRGADGADSKPTEYIQFGFNSFSAEVHEMGQMKPASTSFYNVLRRSIFESNFWRGGGRFTIFGQDHSFRNNLISKSGSGGGGSMLNIVRYELTKTDGPYGPGDQYDTFGIRAHHNTCYFTASSGLKDCIEADGDVAGPNSATNNLVWAPNASSASATDGDIEATTGNVVRKAGDTAPFVDPTPSTLSEFERTAAIIALDAGADPLNGAEPGGGGEGPPPGGDTDLEVTALRAFKTSDDSTLYDPFSGGVGERVSNFPGFAICVKTITGTDPVGRVDFIVDGGSPISDTTAPYCLSDTSGDYTQHPSLSATGPHTIVATPYDNEGDAGVSLGPVSAQVEATAAIEVDHLEVYLPGDEIGVDAPLYAGFTGGPGQPLDLQDGFCVVGIPGGADAVFVESMRFWLTPNGGAEFVSGTESLPPYAQNDAAADGMCTQFDDISTPGIYALRVIPYTGDVASGIAGVQLGSIDLHVVDGTPPPDPPAPGELFGVEASGIPAASGVSF